MNNILHDILATKAVELSIAQVWRPLDATRRLAEQADPPRDFIAAITDRHRLGRPAVIAEIKRASPSHGVIRDPFVPEIIAASYESHGATCLSVLTDHSYFGGAPEYLRAVRMECSLPLLRKDFLIDPYQVYESRALGADCILLIVAALDPEQLIEMERLAHSLGMAVLVEAHDRAELMTALKLKTPLIGINNRDLRTFAVDLETTLTLSKEVGAGRIVVTESGIASREDVDRLRTRGIQTFLVGEAFMRADDPGSEMERLFR